MMMPSPRDFPGPFPAHQLPVTESTVVAATLSAVKSADLAIPRAYLVTYVGNRLPVNGTQRSTLMHWLHAALPTPRFACLGVEAQPDDRWLYNSHADRSLPRAA